MTYCCLEIKIISNVRQWLALHRHSISGNGHYAINSNPLETRDESYLCSPCRAKYLAHSRCSTHWLERILERTWPRKGELSFYFSSHLFHAIFMLDNSVLLTTSLLTFNLGWLCSGLCKWTHLVHAWLSDPHSDIYNPRLCLFWDNMVFFL